MEDCILLQVIHTVPILNHRGRLMGVIHRKVTAEAALNDWAVIKSTDDSGYCVLHSPSQETTGPSMSLREAMRTIVKLKDVTVTRDTIWAVIKAHPKETRDKLRTIVCSGGA